MTLCLWKSWLIRTYENFISIYEDTRTRLKLYHLALQHIIRSKQKSLISINYIVDEFSA